jgi:hypothetical protein
MGRRTPTGSKCTLVGGWSHVGFDTYDDWSQEERERERKHNSNPEQQQRWATKDVSHRRMDERKRIAFKCARDTAIQPEFDKQTHISDTPTSPQQTNAHAHTQQSNAYTRTHTHTHTHRRTNLEIRSTESSLIEHTLQMSRENLQSDLVVNATRNDHIGVMSALQYTHTKRAGKRGKRRRREPRS